MKRQKQNRIKILLLILSCNMILFMILKGWKQVKKMRTTVFSKTKQDDEVIHEKFDQDAAEEKDTGLEDSSIVAFDDLTIPGAKNNYY